ncbi:MAG: hypothetical protein P8X64_01790 [Anaerolineales bacterium]|jgi:hypothetical protein
MRRPCTRLWAGLILFTTLIITSCSTSSEPSAPSPTPLPPEQALPTATEAAPPTATPPPTIPSVVHSIRPGEPGLRNSYLDDVDAQAGSKGISFGDIFAANRYERPFQAGDMVLRPEIDITSAEITFDEQWYYFTIDLQAPPAEGQRSPYYALEIDLDRDGRGDWLFAVEGGLTDGWTTDGVRAWQDANGDVGGPTPLAADGEAADGDGYELLFFDQGYGEDPDAAWARSLPGGGSGMQFAVKRDVLEADAGFLWSAWASAGALDPSEFDLNDRISAAEAGSPILGDADYPLQGLAQLDNTCRMYFGFTPTGNEPGVCALPYTPTPEPSPTPAATATLERGVLYGLVWTDKDLDGVKDSGEPPLTVFVSVTSGSCPSQGGGGILYQTRYIEYGINYWIERAPGTYCIQVGYPGQSTTGGSTRTVDVPAGGQVQVNFGYAELN